MVEHFNIRMADMTRPAGPRGSPSAAGGDVPRQAADLPARCRRSARSSAAATIPRSCTRFARWRAPRREAAFADDLELLKRMLQADRLAGAIRKLSPASAFLLC